MDAVDDPLEIPAYARHEDHVEALAHASATQVVFVDRCVWYAELVERVTRPSFVLRIEPGVVDRDARQVDDVSRHTR